MAKLKVPKKKSQQIVFKDNTHSYRKLTSDLNHYVDEEIVKYNATMAKEIEKAKIEATKEAMMLILPMSCNTLYEAYGIGEKRMEKFLEYFKIHLECLNKGITDLNDYAKWCEDNKIKFFDVMEVEK